MVEKKDIIKELNEFKKRLSITLPVEKMILFGSYAKGKVKKESDIDLIIVSNKFRGVRFRKRPVSLYKHWELDIPFDFLCYTPKEFRKMRKQITIVREAVKEGIAI